MKPNLVLTLGLILAMNLNGCGGGTIGSGTRPPRTVMFDSAPISGGGPAAQRDALIPKEQDYRSSAIKCSLPVIYQESSWLSPNELFLDLDADGISDRAFFVVNRRNSKLGVAICLSSTLKLTVLGAGNFFGNGGDDFSWIDQWSVVTLDTDFSDRIPPNATPKFGLFVTKSESGGGIIYYKGGDYHWRQYGD